MRDAFMAVANSLLYKQTSRTVYLDGFRWRFIRIDTIWHQLEEGQRRYAFDNSGLV